jgi:hypothetical protein
MRGKVEREKKKVFKTRLFQLTINKRQNMGSWRKIHAYISLTKGSQDAAYLQQPNDACEESENYLFATEQSTFSASIQAAAASHESHHLEWNFWHDTFFFICHPFHAQNENKLLVEMSKCWREKRQMMSEHDPKPK